jgi:hypothetical protein
MVIQGLAMKKQHIPYRDSKLTKLLRGQLEGGAKITICVCVADGAEHAEESVCTMRFGSRCAAVSNVAHEQSYGEGGGDPEEALDRCRAELAELEEKGFGETFGQGFPESEVNGCVQARNPPPTCPRLFRTALTRYLYLALAPRTGTSATWPLSARARSGN